jgi:hypothetical protein
MIFPWSLPGADLENLHSWPEQGGVLPQHFLGFAFQSKRNQPYSQALRP